MKYVRISYFKSLAQDNICGRRDKGQSALDANLQATGLYMNKLSHFKMVLYLLGSIRSWTSIDLFCVFICHLCTCAKRALKRVLNPLELELQEAVSHLR